MIKWAVTGLNRARILGFHITKGLRHIRVMKWAVTGLSRARFWTSHNNKDLVELVFVLGIARLGLVWSYRDDETDSDCANRFRFTYRTEGRTWIASRPS